MVHAWLHYTVCKKMNMITKYLDLTSSHLCCHIVLVIVNVNLVKRTLAGH